MRAQIRPRTKLYVATGYMKLKRIKKRWFVIQSKKASWTAGTKWPAYRRLDDRRPKPFMKRSQIESWRRCMWPANFRKKRK